MRKGDSSQLHVDGLAAFDDLRSELPACADDFHLQLLSRPADGDVERGAEGVDVSQVCVVPVGWQAGIDLEGAEASGADSEEAFGKDAAVQGALRSEMPLVAYGPRFHRVRHVLAQEAAARVLREERHGTVGFAGRQRAAKAV